MQLTILGSESAGNCYILRSDTETLILEAGLNINDVKQALGYDLRTVVGCLVTHRHGDHFKYADKYAQFGINIYSSADVVDRMTVKYRGYVVKPMSVFILGGFTIMPFPVPHGVYCYGYLIKNDDFGKLMFVTDAANVPYTFNNLNHILIEANYSDEHMVNDRAVGHHMSLDTCLRFISSQDTTELYNIVLLHLSASNSNADKFRTAAQALAPHATVTIADKGVKVELIKNPF